MERFADGCSSQPAGRLRTKEEADARAGAERASGVWVNGRPFPPVAGVRLFFRAADPARHQCRGLSSEPARGSDAGRGDAYVAGAETGPGTGERGDVDGVPAP